MHKKILHFCLLVFGLACLVRPVYAGMGSVGIQSKGAGGVTSVNGQTGDVTVAASGDNLGNHIMTQPLEATNFAIQGSSQVLIGQATGYAALSVSSASGGGFLFDITTGTQKIFEVTGSSVLVEASLRIGSGTLTIDSQIRAKNGTAALPTYSFYGAPNSGFYQSGTLAVPIINLSLSGGSALTMTDLGSFSLGSRFTQVLNQNGSRAAPAYGFINAAGAGIYKGGTSSQEWYLVNTPGTNPEKIRLNVDGAVVIGGIHPARANLHIASGAISNNPILVVSSGSNILEVTGTSVTISLDLIVSTTSNPQTGFKVSSNSYVNLTSSAPQHALSSCGSNPTIRGGGNMFSITPGSGGPGACTVTFGVPFNNTPVCIAQPLAGSVTNTFSYAYTNTSLTATETAIGTFVVMCSGHE